MASRIRSSRPRRSSEQRALLDETPLSISDVSSKDPKENYRTGLSDSINLKNSTVRRLLQLNFLVRCRKSFGDIEECGIAFGSAVHYLLISLCDPCKEIRAASFRVLRHFTTARHHCEALRTAHVDFYVARALDVSLDNEVERIQAILLARKMVQLGDVPNSIVNAMIGLASEGGEESERMTKICLETLCEILILCPDHPYIVRILRVLMDFLLTSSSLPLTSAVVAAIAHYAGKHQTAVMASQCDITQILSPITTLEGFSDDIRKEAKDAKAVMVQAAKNAIVSALRSWEGLYLLTYSVVTGVESLVGVLSLHNPAAHEAVFDIVSQLLFIPKDYESSLVPCESWSIQEDFVAGEARALLPHIGRTRVNLCANVITLLLFLFQQTRLIEGLVSVITADPDLHRRALYLLNSFLSLANVYLPAEFTTQMQSLPALVSLATAINKYNSRVQGAEAVADLFRLNHERSIQPEMPPNMSLYLEHVLEMCRRNRERKYFDGSLRDLDNSMIRDSLVLIDNTHTSWKWQLIASLLKADAIRASDASGYRFLYKLLIFYKPSNKLFSVIPKKQDLGRLKARCGSYFVEILLREVPDMLEELLTDFTRYLKMSHEDPGADVIFNPLKLLSSCSSDYFMFVGKISCHPEGEKMLQKTGVFDTFERLIFMEDIHESYIKLIITMLDYRNDGLSRGLLRKALNLCSPALRRYATLHLRTLLRARLPGFSEWGMELLIGRLQDANIIVAQTAVEIIDEACDEKANLDDFVGREKPRMEHLHPMTDFLTARVLGTKGGFEMMKEMVYMEILKWKDGFNRRYVDIVEHLLSAKLMCGDSERSMYRQTSQCVCMPEIFLPEHLYGQLVQHSEGSLLIREEMPHLVNVIRATSSEPTINTKSALWALGHIGRTVDGMAMLNEYDVLDMVVSTAAEHPNLSVRGTAYFVLGLWSTTERGADLLKSRDWLAIRHNRHELWPLVDQRVQYTWDNASESITAALPSFNASPRPQRLISFTTAPAHDLRVPSPLFAEKEANVFFTKDGCYLDGPLPHKTSRGESGFESSDGLDSVPDGIAKDHRMDRSASAKTTDTALSSFGSPDDLTDGSPTRLSHFQRSPESHASSAVERSRRTLLRMKSHRDTYSFDEVRHRRSEARHSFRSLVHTMKVHSTFLHRKSSVHSASPPHPSAPSSTSSSIVPGESSAKEEKYIGICVPLRRNMWRKQPVRKSVHKDDFFVGNLVTRKLSHQVDPRNGLELHSVSNCIMCSMLAVDRSRAETTESPVVLKRKEVLRFISALATPLGHKAAEQGLLQLKNQLADSFLDPCLYSEVSHILSAYTFKLSIRRMIQELFLDLPLQKCLLEPLESEVRSVSTPVPEENLSSDDAPQIGELAI
ncbi:rapamycin-insensitive companion of mTOR-like [Paramacrobiotus metropolitanus]|uniref:rapamycin-insensitive companion of mTOR-like n=1 Tax=Paramacrobiotus metropolitanus TaxID=2943436 RepID=UPI002445A7DF|nr:rapamycin-insensitive companion of mTOR-like [Paramacrobiotus metropolitanus]